MEMLREQNKVNVQELAGHFSRSASSIRMDLNELQLRGLVTRTHGGAILEEHLEDNLIWDKQLLQQRLDSFSEEKARIGAATAGLVKDGDAILIDGGSTTYYVVQALSQKRGLTIITTSIHLFPQLVKIPEARVYLTGGRVHKEYLDLVGDISMSSIRKFSPDRTIIGIDGISPRRGLTSTEPTIAPLKQEMVIRSKDLIVVADSSKFGKECLTHVADITPAMTIITDNGVEESMRNEIEARGARLITS